MPNFTSWGPKRWLSSLEYHVSRNVREWRTHNATIQRLRYNPIHALAILGGRHLVASQVTLLGVGLSASCVIAAIQPYVPATWSFWTAPEDPSVPLGVVWTIQVTLAAVVYPIVIGFVGLMFQQQPASSARMTIVLNDSGAKLSGLSSLMLCLVISVQWLFCWHFPIEAITGWLLFDTAWLAVNTAGGMFFLYRTFQVLQPKDAERIVQRYAVGVIWPHEVAESLRSHILAGATQFGLVPRPERDDAMSMIQGKPSIWFTPMMRQSGEACVSLSLRAPRSVRDVRFRPLGWAIRRWLARAEGAERPAGARRRGASLYFPAFPGQEYEEQLDLCRVEGPPLPTRFERWVIRKSYRLSRNPSIQRDSTISDLLQELARDVLDAIEKHQPLKAKDCLDTLVDLHAEIIKAGEFMTTTGGKDNYALLSAYQFMSIPIHDRWLRHYFPIFEAAAAAVPDNPMYFNHAIGVVSDLFSAVRMLRNITIGDRILSLGRIALLKLGAWWIKTIEQQSGKQPHPCAPALLDAYTRRNYDVVLKQFVGAWEQLGKHYFDYGARGKRAPWPDLQLTTHFQTTHLGETVLMFFDAISRGDQQMAEAITDILCQWKPSAHLDVHVDEYLVRSPQLLTLSSIEGGKDALLADAAIPELAPLKRDFVEAGMAVVLDNLWTDSMLAAAYCLAHWGKNCDCGQSLPAQFLPFFLRQRSSSTMVSGMSPAVLPIGKVFWGLVRQNLGEQGYRGKINSLAEKILDIRGPAMISGRIYSYSGSTDLDSVLDGQLIVLCLLIRDGWTPDKGHDREIAKLLGSGMDRAAVIDRWFAQMLTRFQDPGFKDWVPFFNCTAPKMEQALSFDDAIAAVVKSLTSFRNAASAAHTSEMQQAPFDQATLNEVAEWASEQAFSSTSAAVPVSLFKDLQHINAPLEERQFTLNKFDRGEFTAPRRSTRPSGEDEVFASHTRTFVGGFVLHEILKQIQTRVEVRDGENSTTYWHELELAAAALTEEGLTPVLFVENPMTPLWIFDWTASMRPNREERPTGLRVTRQESITVSEYIGHFNQIEVYHAASLPQGASYVFAREAFETVTFRIYGPKRFVRIEPVTGTDKPMEVGMRIIWEQRVKIGAQPAFKLQYGPAKDE